MDSFHFVLKCNFLLFQDPNEVSKDTEDEDEEAEGRGTEGGAEEDTSDLEGIAETPAHRVPCDRLPSPSRRGGSGSGTPSRSTGGRGRGGRGRGSGTPTRRTGGGKRAKVTQAPAGTSSRARTRAERGQRAGRQ